MSLAFDHPHIVVPPDGRQSAHAAAIQRGVGRLLRSYGFAVVTELGLGNGRRADVVGLSQKGLAELLGPVQLIAHHCQNLRHRS